MKIIYNLHPCKIDGKYIVKSGKFVNSRHDKKSDAEKVCKELNLSWRRK